MLTVALAYNASAFEIRPIGVDGGANDDRANGEIIEYLSNSDAHRCSNLWFFPSLNTVPVHEIIVRKAYQFAYGTKLRSPTWKTPLLAGVEWNDDPEELLRRAHYFNGQDNVWKFRRDEANASRPETLTRRTHHGDLQFLHSMRKEDEDDATAKKRMFSWLEYTYTIAIGNVDPDTVRKTSPYHEFFGKVGCMKNTQLPNSNDCTVMDVLDIHRLHRDGDNRKALADLATGAIAHMVQDSYSASHTQRENGTGKLLQMYSYDDANRLHHCESDGLYEKNKPNIEAAIRRTADLLWLVRTKTPWSKAEPFFNDIFAFHQ
jgi:hypothetical protein